MSTNFIRKSYVLIIYFACISYSFGQENDLSFKKLYDQSITQKKEFLNLKDFKKQDKTLILDLFTKENWVLVDLKIVDSLLNSNLNSSPNIKGLYYYIAGNAYNSFDSDLKIKYFQNAYFSYEEINDIEGMFFSLVQIFNSKISTSETDENFQELNKYFEELNTLAELSDYIPVKLALKESYLKKALTLNNEITNNVLSSSSNLAENYIKQYTTLSRHLFTAIGIAHQRNENLAMALFYNRKALAMANSEEYDYPTYIANVGGSHFFNKNYDSAKYYLKTAYYKIPKNPKTVYQTSTKQFIAYYISMLYKDIEDMDSAYFYSQESNHYKSALMSLKLKQSSLYDEKKFEIQKANLKLTKIELELSQEHKINILVIAVLLICLILISFLVYTNKKINNLKEQAEKLKDNRERICRIVSHDLGEPLQVFTDSAVIIPRLIAQKKYRDIEAMQYSLSETIISMQALLKNLFSWNHKTLNVGQDSFAEINIQEQLQFILKSYEDTADIKGLNFDFQYSGDRNFCTDASKLGNLFRNIIYNSVKHSRLNHTIYLQVQIDGDKNLQFECQNTIKSNASEQVKELVKHFNNPGSTDYTYTSLGIELIDDAVNKLKAKVKANLVADIFKISITIPQGV